MDTRLDKIGWQISIFVVITLLTLILIYLFGLYPKTTFFSLNCAFTALACLVYLYLAIKFKRKLCWFFCVLWGFISIP